MNTEANSNPVATATLNPVKESSVADFPCAVHAAVTAKSAPEKDAVTTVGAILEALNISKRFGALQALDKVSIRLRAGSVHALLGENGAGKSTLVKCIMGYYQPDAGQITLAGKEQAIGNPQQASLSGIGMVYQHFTLVDNMTVAENMVIARPDLPAVVNWNEEFARLNRKMQDMPFQLDLNRKVATLATGEKQKLEIIKQLMLDTRVLILDEPTSVLTPLEADEVLTKIKQLTQQQGLTVLMITHKFREVMDFADDVTVLRKGSWAGSVQVSDTSPETLAEMMMGSALDTTHQPRKDTSGLPPDKLELTGLSVENQQGLLAVDSLSLSIRSGEILGIAGVSGNGQSELVAALSGQRPWLAGRVQVDQQAFQPTRAAIRRHRIFCLPEEPLRNACIPDMSVALNLALRQYDQPPLAWFGKVLNFTAITRRAAALIKQFRVKTAGPAEPIEQLSGGNVQRAVLARELSQQVNVLVVANPCFGLDFKAVRDIRNQIMEVRNRGAAVLLVSEDLDEIMELSDRFYVISRGRLVYETRPQDADIIRIGQAMAGQHDNEEQVA